MEEQSANLPQDSGEKGQNLKLNDSLIEQAQIIQTEERVLEDVILNSKFEIQDKSDQLVDVQKENKNEIDEIKSIEQQQTLNSQILENKEQIEIEQQQNEIEKQQIDQSELQSQDQVIKELKEEEDQQQYELDNQIKVQNDNEEQQKLQDNIVKEDENFIQQQKQSDQLQQQNQDEKTEDKINQDEIQQTSENASQKQEIIKQDEINENQQVEPKQQSNQEDNSQNIEQENLQLSQQKDQEIQKDQQQIQNIEEQKQQQELQQQELQQQQIQEQIQKQQEHQKLQKQKEEEEKIEFQLKQEQEKKYQRQQQKLYYKQQDPNYFDYELVIEELEEAQIQFQQCNDYKISVICNYLQQFCNLFQKMGKILSSAFADVKEKADTLRQRSIEYNEPYLYALIQAEIKLNLHQCNGENNKKYTKDARYKTYISASRQMLRMMWFTDFLVLMFDNLGNDRKCNCSTAISQAYETALAPNHTWLVKTGARAAMYSGPSRKDFLYLIVEKDKDENFAYNIMSKLVQVFRPVSQNFWGYYRNNNLASLE